MINSVILVGGGTCGCQVAWQLALHDVPVTLVERDDASRNLARDRLASVASSLAAAGLVSGTRLRDCESSITLLSEESTPELVDQTAGTCDLILESVTEDRETKRAVFARFASCAPSQVIFATNSSYLLPSTFINASGRPERLAGFHFHVPVWYANAVDIMPHARTDLAVVNEAWAVIETQVELRRNLAALERLGADFQYHRLDVGDAESVAAKIKSLTTERQLDGVIYGAGWERTARLEKRTDQDFSLTIAAKVTGLRHLIDSIDVLTAAARPRWLLVNGSVAGSFGGIGQADYALANGIAEAIMMQATAQLSNVRLATIQWPGWDGTGMAARWASRHSLMRSGHRLIPIAEGLDRLRQELARVSANASDPADHDVILIRRREIPARMRVESLLPGAGVAAGGWS